MKEKIKKVSILFLSIIVCITSLASTPFAISTVHATDIGASIEVSSSVIDASVLVWDLIESTIHATGKSDILENEDTFNELTEIVADVLMNASGGNFMESPAYEAYKEQYPEFAQMVGTGTIWEPQPQPELKPRPSSRPYADPTDNDDLLSWDTWKKNPLKEPLIQNPNDKLWEPAPDLTNWRDKPWQMPYDKDNTDIGIEQREELGFQEGEIFKTGEDFLKEVYRRRQKMNGGGGSGGGDSGDSGNNSSKGTKVKIGTGILASVTALVVSLASGKSGNEKIDSLVQEDTATLYATDPELAEDGHYHSYFYEFSSCGGENVTSKKHDYYYYQYKLSAYITKEFHTGDNYLGYSWDCGFNGDCYGVKIYPDAVQNITDLTTGSNSYYSSSGVPQLGKYSYYSTSSYEEKYLWEHNAYTTMPIFKTKQQCIDYANGDLDISNAINYKKPSEKLVWADVKSMAGKLPSTFNSLTNLPTGKALSSNALKDFNKDMTNYRKTASPDDLTNTDTLTKVATETMQKEVEKNTVDEKEKEDEDTKPVPMPEYPTPDKVDIDGLEATRDWRLVFPFCIPFDMIDLYRVFVAEPQAPHWEIPLKSETFNIDYTFVIDFEQFEVLAEIFRTFQIILFILGLCMITSKVIKW